MNREIEFRGIDRRGNWHYGYFWVTAENTHYIKERIAKTHFADFEVTPESVGQYTGWNDKTGKEIYKKDIVRGTGNNESSIREVTMHTFCGWPYIPSEKYIIIGNLTENPELLEEK